MIENEDVRILNEHKHQVLREIDKVNSDLEKDFNKEKKDGLRNLLLELNNDLISTNNKIDQSNNVVLEKQKMVNEEIVNEETLPENTTVEPSIVETQEEIKLEEPEQEPKVHGPEEKEMSMTLEEVEKEKAKDFNKGKNTTTKCSVCGADKFTRADVYEKRVKKFGSVEELLKNYKCRDCKNKEKQ